ncbi:Scaffold-type E3 ligase [Neofusicoccum ribis]|uniref:Scaffold-type E3 ligase n=1 Tax=Neofusicoccum ribis TaxID=45134 RepID=A0ABR3SSM0_9PEZI
MPPAYTTAQKSAIQQVVNFTSCDRTTAARILRNHNWNAEQAINGYVSPLVPSSPPRRCSPPSDWLPEDRF